MPSDHLDTSARREQIKHKIILKGQKIMTVPQQWKIIFTCQKGKEKKYFLCTPPAPPPPLALFQ